jgi:2-polyprenyl-3-methyl-5-hydroxy-6-metoxy-1,4-benzoquinol methylase
VLRPTTEAVVAAWQAVVEQSQEQIARLTEGLEVETEAFWAARAPVFRPGASESEELDYLLSLARPEDEWMDIGAGAGRLAIPLAGKVRHVVTVDTSETMRTALADSAAAAGRTIEAHDARWPEAAHLLPTVDVTLAANMLYTSSDPVAFVEAMEAHSRRLCVVGVADRPPRTTDPQVWEELWGEPLVILPGAREFVTLLHSLGRRIDVATFPAPETPPVTVERALAQHWRYGIADGSPQLSRLREVIERHVVGADGLAHLRGGRSYTAVISWEPPRQG